MTKGSINKCLNLAHSAAMKWLGIIFFRVITVINRYSPHYNNVLLLKYEPVVLRLVKPCVQLVETIGLHLTVDSRVFMVSGCG